MGWRKLTATEQKKRDQKEAKGRRIGKDGKDQLGIQTTKEN